MSSPIISVRNLGKQYRLGATLAHDSLRDQIAHGVTALASLFRKNGAKQRSRPEEFWALKDVSFDVNEGDVVGIIGRNGSGKSTLLKLLSQITEPTTGEIRVRGRIASLLEVGTGFHPELTGRENIFMNGSILGMSRKEITRKFDEIVAFSEVERFIDTPVKRYSSGMYVRLAFSVAAHLQPEILLVDEVLAVGDTTFQKKCLGKMKDISQQGRTVLFVSHNMSAVQLLCNQAVWLREGNLVKQGKTEKVVSEYLGSDLEKQFKVEWPDDEMPGNDRVRLKRASVHVDGKTPGEPMTISTAFTFDFEYAALDAKTHLNLSVFLVNEDNIFVFNSLTNHEEALCGQPMTGRFKSSCQIPAHLLNEGTYRVLLRFVSRGVNIFVIDDVLVFDLKNDVELRGGRYAKWPGVIRPNLNWQTELLEK